MVGANVAVNANAGDPLDITANNSPTLVRNPTDAANVVIVNRIDLPQFSCALHLSFDGGSTWESRELPTPEGDEERPCFAPDAAFGPNGTLYLYFSTLQPPANLPSGGWLVSSSDGGRTLSPPTRVLEPLGFQVRLAPDPHVAGRLHLSWLQAATTTNLGFGEPGAIHAKRSDDGGTTWSSPVRVSPPNRARAVAPSPAVGGPDEVYVLYLDLGDDRLDYHGAHEGRGGPPYPGTWALVLARSQDGGVTWQELVVEPGLVPTQRFVAYTPPFPSLAIDRDRGQVYAAFADGRSGDADVRVWASSDGGATFTNTTVNGTPTGDGTDQYLPALAVAPDGRLDVVYYDRRADQENVMNEVSLQSSSDGGRSFTRPVRLSDRPFDSRIGFGGERGMADLGSRLALLSTDGRAMAVWTDTRQGTEALDKQDIMRAVLYL